MPWALPGTPGFHGYVGKCAVAIVLEEMRRGFAAGGEAFEARSVHQENVEPAVVVVVIERDSAASGLQQVFVLMLAAVNGIRV